MDEVIFRDDPLVSIKIRRRDSKISISISAKDTVESVDRIFPVLSQMLDGLRDPMCAESHVIAAKGKG